MLTQMGEQVAKEVRKCDKEAIAAVKKNLNGARRSAVGSKILDKICQILEGKENVT